MWTLYVWIKQYLFQTSDIYMHILKHTTVKNKQDLKTSNNANVNRLLQYVCHKVNDVYSDITIHTYIRDM